MRKTSLLAALTMSAALFFTACQKEQAENLINSTTKTFPMPSNGGFRSLPTMPSVQNGMLKFTDQTHFDEYLAYLDALVMDEPQNEGQTDTDSTEFHDKLLQVETNLNFSSLRAQLVSDFENLNEDGFATLEEIPATHFIADAAMQSILNPNQEYQVGTSVFVYYNANYLVEILDANSTTRETVKELRMDNSEKLHPKVPRLPKVIVHGLNGYQYLHFMDKEEKSADRYKNLFEWNTVDLEVKPTPNCQARTAIVEAILMYNNSNGVISEATLTPCDFIYDWGDNTTITYNVGNYKTTQQNTYANAGWANAGRSISIQVTAVDANNNVNGVTNATAAIISNVSCADRRLEAPVTWNYSSNGQWAYRRELVKYRRSSNQGRACATTCAFRLVNGRWKSRKADRLATQLWAGSKNDDCTGGQYQVGAVWPYNAKEAQVAKNVSVRTANNDVNSNHQLYVGNAMHSQNHLLIACP